MSRSKLSNQELKFYNTAGESDVIYAKLKGSSTDTVIFEGASSATKVKLKNVADPTTTGEVATYDYVNTKVNELSNGLSWKAPVRAKSTANIAGTLSGSVFTCTANAQQTLDNTLIVLNDRVLLANQTAQLQNGIYICTTQGNARSGSEQQAVFSRASDAGTIEFKSMRKIRVVGWRGDTPPQWVVVVRARVRVCREMGEDIVRVCNRSAIGCVRNCVAIGHYYASCHIIHCL